MENFNHSLQVSKERLNKGGIVAIIESTKHTDTWKDNKLNKWSPEFNEEIYNKKIARLKRGAKAIKRQREFEIASEWFDRLLKLDFWILKMLSRTA